MNKIYTVAQVNGYIKRLFVSDYALNHIYMKGEVSNCKYHSSGHIYFTLKDQESAISCVMFAGSRKEGLTFQLADGQSVVAGGNVSVYERDGKYQLYAKEIFLHGAGALYEEYERLKKKLSDEGLFDSDKKKTIPMFPKKVGIVTSKTGAAIRDIESIAKRRNPYVQLVLYPAQVQGVGAGKTIAKGIEQLDKMNMDTIIIGRGGGSIEDLWAFNEEIVARAIFRANTPIISGTGHETDTTIADYVADLRAATPSAACELAIPDYFGMLEQFRAYEQALRRPIEHKIQTYRYQLDNKQWQLERVSPKQKLQEKKMRLADLEIKLQDIMEQKIERKRHQIALYTEKLHGLSPTAKLTGGYGFITDKDKKVLRSVTKIQEGDTITVTLIDGEIEATVQHITEQK
ncbi:MAG: exodeoxyribonuclease VII large subunit [Firmicutes bacterium]|uniref:Exodeoxyribonuclease 7 large subunit n=1 Tax=Candidatus Scybalomonas excrementavium TaxID=2840943 RepID=A0A9D9I340_9FIRM|nr:exodeoxyribonuclease VII large subunit [Candidatus Scybalomonas excrementavium]